MDADLPKSNYSVGAMIVISMVGIIIKLFFGEGKSVDGESGPATSAIWGYGLTAFSLFFILFLGFALDKDSQNKLNVKSSAGKYTQELFINNSPTLVTLGVFIYLIWLNTAYFKQLNTGKVANEYYEISNIGTIMLLFQLATLFKLILMENTGNEGRKSNLSSIIYLLSIINSVIIIIMNIILAYFSTDG